HNSSGYHVVGGRCGGLNPIIPGFIEAFSILDCNGDGRRKKERAKRDRKEKQRHHWVMQKGQRKRQRIKPNKPLHSVCLTKVQKNRSLPMEHSRGFDRNPHQEAERDYLDHTTTSIPLRHAGPRAVNCSE